MGLTSVLGFVTKNAAIIDTIIEDVKSNPVLRNLSTKFKPGMSETAVYAVLVSLSDNELDALSAVIAKGLRRAATKHAC